MKQGEEGYILASAIGILLAISIVAAALVSASADTLSRIRQAEIDARVDAVLQSALILVGSQLVLDPRRRQVMIDDASNIDLLGETVSLKIRWESSKLDVNLAQLDEIAAMLTDQHMRQDVVNLVMPVVRESRLHDEPVRLIKDLGVSRSAESCLSSILTVFGGRTGYDRQNFDETVPIGQPAPGSRLSVDLTVTDKSKGVAAVMLVTGDPLAPVRLLDWRETRGTREEDCREF